MIYVNVRWKKQTGIAELNFDGLSFRVDGATAAVMQISWSRISKHQVSPASYPKALLKLNLTDGSNTTFQFPDRASLDKIRKEITQWLQQQHHQRNGNSNNNNMSPPTSGKKRAFSEVAQSPVTAGAIKATGSFGDLDHTALAVTRSTLLAAHPNLQQQHQYLVEETKTVSEEDFWKTHQSLLEEEYARMSGVAKAGSTSLLQSHVPSAGKVTLGVEEMRQIFILYPAVHKAYEEKVPLSLSDEEFWRKYLESEYFHRDRGRMGTMFQSGKKSDNNNNNNSGGNAADKKANAGPTLEEQDARAAAVSADDLFSRYEQKLSETKARAAAEAKGDSSSSSSSSSSRRRWGTRLAVGQFDLAQTLETERGKLLEGPRDNHPPNSADDGGKGARVIEKYNRHWAMVLHPEEAVAGSNLLHVARRSVHDALPNDNDQDAKARGGLDREMRQLSDFASAPMEDANHASCIGVHEGENYLELALNNEEAYYGNNPRTAAASGPASKRDEAAMSKKHADFSAIMAGMVAKSVSTLRSQDQQGVLPDSKCFPDAELGRMLLLAMTRKMAQDARTEATSLDMVNRLPDDFRKSLQTYFRRSSELLRHFFGLRRLEEEYNRSSSDKSGFSKKLKRINTAMENLYREIEGMRNGLPQTETGEMMRKMCLPIMEQLDWAFKIHRERSGGGGGGGFVDVEEN